MILFDSVYEAGGTRVATVPNIIVPDVPFRALVGVGAGICTVTNPEDFVSFKFNSVGMNKHVEYDCTNPSNHHLRLQMWYMLNPPVGTYNMTMTYELARNFDTTVQAIVLTGVKQVAPLTAAMYRANMSDNTLSVTSIDNGCVIEMWAAQYGDIALTPQSGQTEMRESYRYVLYGINLATARLNATGTPTSVRYTASASRYSSHIAACFTAQVFGGSQTIWAM